MTVARLYRMNAPEGGGDALLEALARLSDAVRSLPGCEGVEILRDAELPHAFVFNEKWTSIEAHKAAGPILTKDVLKPVMAALASPPDGAYLDYVETA